MKTKTTKQTLQLLTGEYKVFLPTLSGDMISSDRNQLIHSKKLLCDKKISVNGITHFNGTVLICAKNAKHFCFSCPEETVTDSPLHFIIKS